MIDTDALLMEAIAIRDKYAVLVSEADRSHLVKKVITDKRGHKRTVWVKPADKGTAKKPAAKKAPAKKTPAKPAAKPAAKAATKSPAKTAAKAAPDAKKAVSMLDDLMSKTDDQAMKAGLMRVKALLSREAPAKAAKAAPAMRPHAKKAHDEIVQLAKDWKDPKKYDQKKWEQIRDDLGSGKYTATELKAIAKAVTGITEMTGKQAVLGIIGHLSAAHRGLESLKV